MDLDQHVREEYSISSLDKRFEKPLPPNKDRINYKEMLNRLEHQETNPRLKQDEDYKINNFVRNCGCGCLIITGLIGMTGITAFAIYTYYH